MSKRSIGFFSLFFLITAAALVGCNGEDLTIDPGKIEAPDTNAPPVNLSAEIARAKADNKLLLLEFGSSDSCPPCIAFEQKVFSTPEFKAYAKSNLNFVRLDFPFRTSLRPDVTATNNLLAGQFDADVFPTFIALDKNGKEFWRTPIVDKLNETISSSPLLPTNSASLFVPTNFIAVLEKVKKLDK